MVVWSEEASQRRDLKHPDVRVATLDLRKKSDFQISHIVLHIFVACGCIPSYSKAVGAFLKTLFQHPHAFCHFASLKHSPN